MASRIRTQLLLQTLHGLENEGTSWGVTIWQPRVDVYEMANAILILVEAPGLLLEDLKLHFEPGSLLVEGIRSQTPLPAEARAALVEMNYGPFRRRFVLPPNADGDGIAATYEAGILQISVPRSEKNAPKQIPVKSSGR
ncbi:Hsp20/alpha crystallin family protein [bacterium]|nr:MAG: Hsp20/alpha crystallin family protein [bacterium]